MQQHSAMLWRVVRRWVALAIGVASAVCLLMYSPAQAQQVLACGVPATHHLDSGSIDTYQLAASSEQQVVVDVVDTSGTIGLLQLHAPSYGDVNTCDGSLAFQSSPIEVSDCIGGDVGDYSVEFNVVAQSFENCGIPLSCGVAPTGTALGVPGEVDAYTFAGVAGQQVSLTTTATGDTTGSLRMRSFSPTGALQGDSCSGSLTFNVPSTGTYTVLVSACITPSTGPYTIVWQTLPACAAATSAAFAYVTYSNSGTVGVVDLATNRTVSIVPALVPVQFTGDNFSAITASSNYGFVYATFGMSAFGSSPGTISIINTTLNRVVGSLNVPGSDDMGVALDPQGRYAYAVSDVLNGVAVINTATRKIEAIIPIEGYHIDVGLEAAAIAVSPDGKSVYVGATFQPQPGEYQRGLIVIDTVSRTVVGRVTDPRFRSDQLLDISFNPTATLAYVASVNALFVVDTASRSVSQSLPLAVTGIAYSHDGRVGYAVGCPGAMGGGCADPQAQTAVLVIDIASLTITNTIPLQAALPGGNTAGVALSPDGGRLLVTNPDATAQGQQPAVIVIDTATLQVVGAIPAVGDEPYDVAIVTPPSGLCTADDSGQTRVTVGELVTSVNYSVDGCPTARTNRPAVP
jgi:YVTN family beta-propeller protein